MTVRFHTLLALGAMLWLSTGCGLLRRTLHWGAKPAKADPNAGKELFIGVVDMVNPEQHFVLIRTGVNMTLKTGTALEARSPEGNRSGLTVTPEHKTNYISADIANGTPKRGDFVILLQPDPKEKTATDGETEPATPLLKPYIPSEADAPIAGQTPSLENATVVPGVAPADGDMTPGVAPKNLKPAAEPSPHLPGGGGTLPPVIKAR